MVRRETFVEGGTTIYGNGGSAVWSEQRFFQFFRYIIDSILAFIMILWSCGNVTKEDNKECTQNFCRELL
jgi:hypothetical protein